MIRKPAIPRAVEELELADHLERELSEATVDEIGVVRCPGCGAETELGDGASADVCAFCATALIAHETTRERLRPRAMLLPGVAAEAAQEGFDRWLASLWFAPSALRRDARRSSPLQGVFLPFWSFDAKTQTTWSGERGDRLAANGKHRLYWRKRSGNVDMNFDDLLIPATRSIPEPMLRALEPWDLMRRVEYKPELLAGFRAERYAVDPAAGFDAAKQRIEEIVTQRIASQIGGDEQRIDDIHTVFADLRFQHWLLPVWASAYRFRGKPYRFVVNARSGEVQGERPWSRPKLAGVMLAGAALLGWVLVELLKRGS